MSINQKALLAACKAHDREQAACMGEPSPWSVADAESDTDWVSERLAAMQLAIEAYNQTCADMAWGKR